ncbi:MAG: hypothetical protein LBO62_00330, partial [Endomicrobium sp.]|nr:hypothetical protein [Endomicrobium sp.]
MLNNNRAMSKLLPVKIISFFIFITAFLSFGAAVLYAYGIDISADSLEYDQNCGKIFAKGNVELIWEGKNVKSDYAEFLTDQKVINAYGNVTIEEAGAAVYAKSVSYSYNEEKGEIKETLAYSSMLFIRSKSMERQNKTYSMSNVQIALCDLDEPHVYFKARRGKITLGERITIYNPVLYVGKIPIFYLPIITKSLKGGKGLSANFSYNFEPGYTSQGGFSLKNMFGYQFTEAFSGKAMADYYGSRGMGYGLEFNYYDKKGANASLYAYNINDLYTGTERWTLRPNYNHRIGKWNIQSRGEFISDNSFNNYYNQNDWNRTMNTLNSYFSLTRQSSLGNFLIAVQRIDQSDLRGKFYTQSMSLPKI